MFSSSNRATTNRPAREGKDWRRQINPEEQVL